MQRDIIVIERSPTRPDTWRARHVPDGWIRQGFAWRTQSGAVKAARQAYPDGEIRIDDREWQVINGIGRKVGPEPKRS